MPSALVSMLVRLTNLKFVIVTLGEEGCIMLQRFQNGENTYVITQGLSLDTHLLELFMIDVCISLSI